VPADVQGRAKQGYRIKGSVQNAVQVRRRALTTVSTTEIVPWNESENLSWHTVTETPGRCFAEDRGNLGSVFEHLDADQTADRSTEVLDLFRILDAQRFDASKKLKSRTRRSGHNRKNRTPSTIQLCLYLEIIDTEVTTVSISTQPKLSPVLEEEVSLAIRLARRQGELTSRLKAIPLLEHLGFHFWMLQQARGVYEACLAQWNASNEIGPQVTQSVREFFLYMEPLWSYHVFDPELSSVLAEVEKKLRLAPNWDLVVARLARLLNLT